MSKGQLGGKTGFMMFSILFIVVVSTAANQFNVSGINCSDPADLISEPDENATTVDRVLDPANTLVDIFFGCSSSNPIVNGIFVAMSAAFIIILLYIAKDLVPLT